MTEEKKIAKRLTKEDRKYFRRLLKSKSSARTSLLKFKELGLIEADFDDYLFTPLGLAVARELEARDEGEAQ